MSGPYRTAPHPQAAEVRERRGASAIPLGFIALTFYMPFTTDCGDKAVSPMSECHGLMVLWIAPPFLAAALLCMSIVHSVLTKSFARWLTLAAGAICAGSASIMTVAAMLDAKATWGWCVPTAAAVPFFVFACKRHAWRQITLVLDTYILSSLPLAIVATMTAQFYGAFIFAMSFMLLFAMRGFALVAWIRGRGWRRLIPA